MTALCRKALWTIPVITGCLLHASPLWAEDVDATLSNAEQLLSRAVSQVKDTPLADSRDAGQVISALRSSRDKDLLPLFEKIRQSSAPENQVYGMIAADLVTKDPQKLNMDVLLGAKDPGLVASAVATLIDSDLISSDQLQKVLHDCNDATVKAMAVGELDHRKALKDRGILRELLKSEKDVVRYYSAITILAASAAGGDSSDNAAALAALHELSSSHNLRQAAVQAMMLVRVQKENITPAGPWVAEVAADEQNDEGLRFTAITTLLAIKHPDSSRILAQMIQSKRETIQQVKLGLISLEFAGQLKPEVFDPLVTSRSALVTTLGGLAKQSARGTDITTGLVKLLKEGHPIVLDWALAYSDRTDPDRRLAILGAIVNQATIVDDIRGRDYERAAVAAEKLIESTDKSGRALIPSFLRSGNRAVTEAVLAGIYRSTTTDQSELVLPVWDTLRKTKGNEMATNYAALILGREGHREATEWLAGMVMGGTVTNPGFRGVAGWYYAKLQGKAGTLLQKVLAV